jgi:hypothetical protein
LLEQNLPDGFLYAPFFFFFHFICIVTFTKQSKVSNAANVHN